MYLGNLQRMILLKGDHRLYNHISTIGNTHISLSDNQEMPLSDHQYCKDTANAIECITTIKN